MIVSGFEGVMSINGVYNSSRGKRYTMSLVSTKSNIESIVLVAAILDFFNVTLPHVNGDDHIGFLDTCNLYGGLTTSFLCSRNNNTVLMCTVRSFAGGHLGYMKLLTHQSNFENIG